MTYDGLNTEIVGLLRMSDDAVQRYAAERIEALEQQLKETEATVRKLGSALAEAAQEISCAGPVAHRIRVFKRDVQEKITRLEAAYEIACSVAAELGERLDKAETAGAELLSAANKAILALMQEVGSLSARIKDLEAANVSGER